MITIDIPGYKKIEAEHLILDFNGTLAFDGRLIEGVKALLNELGKQLTLHVVTADTFGTTQEELPGIPCTVEILNPVTQDVQKDIYIHALKSEKVIAIGNGTNDAHMLKSAALSIAVIQKEGASIKALMNADIVCHSITDALELLNHPNRIAATLRK